MAYHERALHNYFIPWHRKYLDQHNQSDIRVAHDGKAGYNTVKSTRYNGFLVLIGWIFYGMV